MISRCFIVLNAVQVIRVSGPNFVNNLKSENYQSKKFVGLSGKSCLIKVFELRHFLPKFGAILGRNLGSFCRLEMKRNGLDKKLAPI